MCETEMVLQVSHLHDGLMMVVVVMMNYRNLNIISSQYYMIALGTKYFIFCNS